MQKLLCLLLLSSTIWAADLGINKEWPTFNGDYTGARYSRLAQIDQTNVNRLTLAWVLQPESAGIKSMPLSVNGVLYFTTPDNVWAADSRTGKMVWHYFRESTGDHIGQRGVGMY
jgi:alcohol dehydrogenase (cytochrome c)